MESLISRLSHACDTAQTLSRGMALAKAGSYDVVFLDVRLPDGNGLDILSQLMALPDPPEVIVLTGRGDPDGAEMAIEGGVWDYLLKPSSVREISLSLGRALKYREEKAGKAEGDSLDLSEVVGGSPTIKASFKLMAQAAYSDTNVLITGETGTGKELFASTIHQNSRRHNGQFVVVDCAGLTETLVESTLFGHRKGGVHRSPGRPYRPGQAGRQGYALSGRGGRDAPGHPEGVFARGFRNALFVRWATTREQTSDFRLVAATNRDLDAMVGKGAVPGRSALSHQDHAHPSAASHPAAGGTFAPWPCSRWRGCASSTAWKRRISAPTFSPLLRAIAGRAMSGTLQYPGAGRDRSGPGADHLRHAPAPQPAHRGGQGADRAHDRLAGGRSRFRIGGRSVCPKNRTGDFSRTYLIRPCRLCASSRVRREKVYLGELIRQCAGDLAQILKVSGLSRSHFYSLLKKYGLVPVMQTGRAVGACLQAGAWGKNGRIVRHRPEGIPLLPDYRFFLWVGVFWASFQFHHVCMEC